MDVTLFNKFIARSQSELNGCTHCVHLSRSIVVNKWKSWITHSNHNLLLLVVNLWCVVCRRLLLCFRFLVSWLLFFRNFLYVWISQLLDFSISKRLSAQNFRITPLNNYHLWLNTPNYKLLADIIFSIFPWISAFI